jgi:hypothetical protein
VPLWNLNGAAGMQYRGAYVAATPYSDGDVVIYQGVTYICVRPTTNAPSAAPPAWPAPAQDIWHVVGAAGEPAFLNGYANWDGAQGVGRNPRFRKLSNGIVILSGVGKSPSPVTSLPMFNLPAGYRPGGAYDVAVTIQAASALAFANVSPTTGAVAITGSVTAASWLYLDGVYFYAEQ